MRVLVTGSDGYIGAVMAPFLAAHGHDVVGLDTGFYRSGWLYNPPTNAPACINKDVRETRREDLAGFDAVVHLAELSNDPLGQTCPEATWKINHLGSVTLAREAKSAGIRRFVYSSSCSVYGAGDDSLRTEESAVNPQTAYAECKLLVEREVSLLADDHFSPTYLRNSTAYGPSPRMRFDTVLNNLAGFAWTIGEIRMTSNGMPWRPLVHVLDICEAVACTLAAPEAAIHNQVFNVGDSNQNYRVKEIAEVIAATFPGCTLTLGTNDHDTRSYRVSFDKIHTKLPGFQCRRDAVIGAQQLHSLFQQIDMQPGMFEFPAFTRLRQIEELLRTGQINRDLFWTCDLDFAEMSAPEKSRHSGVAGEQRPQPLASRAAVSRRTLMNNLD